MIFLDRNLGAATKAVIRSMGVEEPGVATPSVDTPGVDTPGVDTPFCCNHPASSAEVFEAMISQIFCLIISDITVVCDPVYRLTPSKSFEDVG